MKFSLFFLNSTRPNFLWGTLSLLVLAGCRSDSTSDADLKSALDPDIKAAKASSKNLKNIAVQNWELSGQDERHRPLWSLSARETRIGEGSELQPKRATLTDASAKLFRDGKLETSFRAARIEFLSTPQGIRMQMSGGVQAQTSVRSKGEQRGLSGPIALQAPRVDVSVKERRVFAPGSVRLTAGKGAQAIVIESRTLRADSALNRAELGGGVRVSSNEGAIASQNATWNWKSGRAQARGNVVASRPGTTLRGDRLEADVRGGRGLLIGQVRAQSSGSNGQAIAGQARAGAISFDWKARTLLSRDGVTIERDGATLQAARVESDLKLDRATATGGVSLQKDGATLRAGRLDAALSGNSATATGGVTLQRAGVTLRAARVQGFDRLTRAVASGDVSLVRGDLNVRANRVEAFDIGNQTSLRVEADGGVRAQNAQGRVRAGRATWGGGRVVASGGVTLEKGGYTLSGARLSSDDRFVRATLSGGVRGALNDGGTIGAGVLVKNGEQLSATGGVRAQRGKLRLRGERLETTISGNHARLSGGVQLVTVDGAVMSAPALRWDRAADKVYGEGGARYYDPVRKLNSSGRTVVINRVSDEKRREAVITGVSASGQMKSLQDIKF